MESTVSGMQRMPMQRPINSRTTCWYQIPEIKKDVDAFFGYPTEYMAANEGDPDYTPLDTEKKA